MGRVGYLASYSGSKQMDERDALPTESAAVPFVDRLPIPYHPPLDPLVVPDPAIAAIPPHAPHRHRNTLALSFLVISVADTDIIYEFSRCREWFAGCGTAKRSISRRIPLLASVWATQLSVWVSGGGREGGVGG
jgi:hypothetical protein